MTLPILASAIVAIPSTLVCTPWSVQALPARLRLDEGRVVAHDNRVAMSMIISR
jgi:hypothetical protein